MKLFHYLDTAGVASVLAKYQQRGGHDVTVYVRGRDDDRFQFGDAYIGVERSTFSNTYCLVLEGVLKMRGSDVVIIHNHDKVIPHIRRLYKRKPIWLIYHGIQSHGLWNQEKPYWCGANEVFCVTSDLLENAPENVRFIHRPVDRELFYDMHFDRQRKRTVLFLKHYRSQFYTKYVKPHVDELISEYSIPTLEVINNDEIQIPHKRLPHFLNSFEYVIDIPMSLTLETHIVENELSLIGLQALACGCKVLQPWEDKPLIGFPEDHDARNVVNKLEKMLNWK